MSDSTVSPTQFRKWWRRMWIAILVLVVLTVIYWTLVFVGVLPGIGYMPVTIAPETTYLTEPLTVEGRVDYAAVINARRSAGVTPETNAYVLLLEAFGPTCFDTEYAFHKKEAAALGIAPLPPDGDYLIPTTAFFEQLLDQQFASGSEAHQERLEELWDEQQNAQEKPWVAEEHPEVHAWIVANETALRNATAASFRPDDFRPVLVDRNDPDLPSEGSLGAALLPHVWANRELFRLLTTRAMWHLGEGRLDDTMADLLTLRRLAGQLGSSGTIIDMYVAHAAVAIAARAEWHLLRERTLSAQQAEFYKTELRTLGPVNTLPELAEIHSETERLLELDLVQQSARGEIDVLEFRWDRERTLFPVIHDRRGLGINTNVILVAVNECFDEIAAALALPTHAQRVAELQTLKTKYGIDRPTGDWQDECRVLLAGPRGRAKMIGMLCARTQVANALGAVDSHARMWMRYEVHLLGFALAEYRADHGRYPKQLADLVPEYVDRIPEDILSGGPLVYETTPDGQEMKVYSVGNNGIDDGGFSFPDRGVDYEKYNECDDLVIRTKFFDPPAEESVEENGGPSETSPNR